MSKPSRFEREISRQFEKRRQQRESAKRGNIDPDTMGDISDNVSRKVEEIRARQRRKRIAYN